MKNSTLVLLLLVLAICYSPARGQQIKDYVQVEIAGAKLPVLLRGNLDQRKILLFVQGGPGETAIDFARADYPKWKHTLEKKVAIAYYDQRGLNKRVKKIDTTAITFQQYGDDLIALAKFLKQEYRAEIYLFGHSAGGRFILHCLHDHPDQQKLLSGAIVANTPMTNDYTQERYTHYRPLYLKNLAMEQIEKGQAVEKWQEAHDWMEEVDSIHTPEISQKWNQYVDSAFEPHKRKMTLGMALKVLFSRPYHPLRYAYRKDNEWVSDLFWRAGKTELPVQEMTIPYPVLIITGRYDDIAPPEEMRVMQQHLSSSQLVVLPQAAHESYLDQPEMFQQSILTFLHTSP